MAGEKIKKLEEEIGALESQYGGRTFSYDPDSDAGYQDYLKLMQDNGKKAMEDTVGKAAALTGGYGNSYAATAGQQVYNDFMKQGVEAQASFRQLARDQFDAENQDILNRLGMLKQQKSDIWEDAARKAGFGDYSGYVGDLGLYEDVETAQKALGAAPNDDQIEYAKKIFETRGRAGLDEYIASLDVGNADSLIEASLEGFKDKFIVTKDGGKNYGGGLNENAKLSLNGKEHSVKKWFTILQDDYGFTADEAYQLLIGVQDNKVTEMED